MKATELAKILLSYMPMDHKKLQKIVYYAQAWHYTLHSEPLIDDHFEAWVHGPVCPTLYQEYKHYGWQSIPSTEHEVEGALGVFLDSIIETFGSYSGDQLEYMTHLESPWKDARGGLEPWESCNAVISLESMRDYCTKLIEKNQLE